MIWILIAFMAGVTVGALAMGIVAGAREPVYVDTIVESSGRVVWPEDMPKETGELGV